MRIRPAHSADAGAIGANNHDLVAERQTVTVTIADCGATGPADCR